MHVKFHCTGRYAVASRQSWRYTNLSSDCKMVDYLSSRGHLVARTAISLSYFRSSSRFALPRCSQGESEFPPSPGDGCNFWPEVSPCYLPEFSSLACSPETRRGYSYSALHEFSSHVPGSQFQRWHGAAWFRNSARFVLRWWSRVETRCHVLRHMHMSYVGECVCVCVSFSVAVLINIRTYM